MLVLLVASLLAVVVHFWDTPACVEPKGCIHLASEHPDEIVNYIYPVDTL